MSSGRGIRIVAPDLALAFGLATLMLLALAAHKSPYAQPGHSYRGTNGVAVLLVLAQTLPLQLRRRWPLTVLGTSLIAQTAYSAMDYYPMLGFGLAGPVALYSVAAHSNRRRAVLAAAVVAVLLSGYIRDAIEHSDPTGALYGYGVWVLAWLLGDTAKRRERYMIHLRDRAQSLENDREERERRAVAEERARIARELHDIIAHHMSIIVIQATAAQRVSATDREASDRALEQVAAVGRQALSETRRLFAVLRAEESEDERSPLPGLQAVEPLVEQVRSAGIDADLTIEGASRVLSESLELTAYRIIQEALTNVLKHGSATRAWIRIGYGTTGLSIDIKDNGLGARESARLGEGQGLVGMRERADLFGGRCEAGTLAAGGFEVRAYLPFGADRE